MAFKVFGPFEYGLWGMRGWWFWSCFLFQIYFVCSKTFSSQFLKLTIMMTEWLKPKRLNKQKKLPECVDKHWTFHLFVGQEMIFFQTSRWTFCFGNAKWKHSISRFIFKPFFCQKSDLAAVSWKLFFVKKVTCLRTISSFV